MGQKHKENIHTNPTFGLLRNIFFSTASWASSVVFLILLILAARYLGDEEYGKFSFAFAFVALFEVLADLGLKEYLLRESARKKDRTIILVGNGITAKIILSGVTAILLVTVSSFMSIEQDVRIVIYLLTFSALLKSYKLLFRSIFIGHEQFKLEAIVVLIERVILLVLGVIVLVMGWGLILFAIVFMISGFISLISVIAFYNHYIGKLKIIWDFSYVKNMVKNSLPFGMTAAAFMIYFRVDTVMLSMLKNDAEVGWYNAAYRLIEGLIVLPTIIYYVLFPRLSVLHEAAAESVLKLSQMACKYTIAIALLIVFLGMITGEKLILLIYGKEYVNSVGSWRILLMGVTFMFLWSVFVVILNSTNRPQIPFMGVLVGSATNIILNLFLIPKYGYIGTSVSTVASEIVLFCFLLVALSRNGFALKLIENAVKPILASAVSMGIILLFLKGNEVVAVLIGAISYLAALYIFGFFNEEEKKLLRSLKTSLINSSHNKN